MTKPNFYSPLKIGLLIVTLAYFLFTLHAMFTLSWIGEWESFGDPLRSIVLIEDITAAIGIAFRLAASAIAFGAVLFYFVKKSFSTQTIMKQIKLVLVGEALYWLMLLVTGILSLFFTLGFTIWRVDGHISYPPILTSLLIYQVPLLVESIAIPTVLFKLTYELKPNKPMKKAIAWGLIAGVVYILVFWLTNTAIWVSTVMRLGIQYLTSYPQNLLSFGLTVIGLLALAIFTAYFAKKSIRADGLGKRNIRTIGAIITILGLFYLWNYLMWVLFGSDEIWSNWYGWFLGNNLNLWLLSIPMVGIPLLFESYNPIKMTSESQLGAESIR